MHAANVADNVAAEISRANEVKAKGARGASCVKIGIRGTPATKCAMLHEQKKVEQGETERAACVSAARGGSVATALAAPFLNDRRALRRPMTWPLGRPEAAHGTGLTGNARFLRPPRPAPTGMLSRCQALNKTIYLLLQPVCASNCARTAGQDLTWLAARRAMKAARTSAARRTRLPHRASSGRIVG